MIVKVDLDPRLVWQLSEAAERRRVSMSELVAGLIASKSTLADRNRERGDVTRKWVRELHSEGLADGEIANHLGQHKEHIARVRRGLGLKPNKSKEEVT